MWISTVSQKMWKNYRPQFWCSFMSNFHHLMQLKQMLCQDLEWLSSFDFYVTFPGRDVSIPRVQIPNLHNREVGIRVSHIHTSSGLLSELEGTREMPDMVTDVPGHSVSDCKSVSNFLLPSFHKAWHPHCNRTSASTCSFGGGTHLLKPSNTIFYVIVNDNCNSFWSWSTYNGTLRKLKENVYYEKM